MKLQHITENSQTQQNLMDLVSFTIRFAGHRRLTQVASSLTFTTVLAIVPLLAVVLALFTAFPLFSEFHNALEEFLGESLLPPSVADTIMQYLNQFASQASGLTAIGSAFLVVTSIMLIMTIDQAFNEIWNVNHQRPVRQRLLVYWAIISLGPILVGASLWASSILARESLGYIADLPGGITFILEIIPFLISILGFTALYMFVPNTRVYWRDALLGGFGAALVLTIMKAGFTWYISKFPTYMVIYGAFATLPIFLLWIYLSWLVILLGATVACLLPALRLHRWANKPQQGAAIVDAINILCELWLARSQKTPGCSQDFLVNNLRIHPDSLSETLQCMQDLGYVVFANDSNHWVLACDPDEANLGPLTENLLFDKNNACALPFTAEALASTLLNKPPSLSELFKKMQSEKNLQTNINATGGTNA